MKIKDGFVLREVVGSWMVVPTGEQASKIHGLISLNETAAVIWKYLTESAAADRIAENLCKEYHVEEEEARQAVEELIEQLKEKDILE